MPARSTRAVRRRPWRYAGHARHAAHQRPLTAGGVPSAVALQQRVDGLVSELAAAREALLHAQAQVEAVEVSVWRWRAAQR
jgi:hypothetical protein